MTFLPGSVERVGSSASKRRDLCVCTIVLIDLRDASSEGDICIVLLICTFRTSCCRRCEGNTQSVSWEATVPLQD